MKLIVTALLSLTVLAACDRGDFKSESGKLPAKPTVDQKKLAANKFEANLVDGPWYSECVKQERDELSFDREQGTAVINRMSYKNEACTGEGTKVVAASYEFTVTSSVDNGGAVKFTSWTPVPPIVQMSEGYHAEISNDTLVFSHISKPDFFGFGNEWKRLTIQRNAFDM